MITPLLVFLLIMEFDYKDYLVSAGPLGLRLVVIGSPYRLQFLWDLVACLAFPLIGAGDFGCWSKVEFVPMDWLCLLDSILSFSP